MTLSTAVSSRKKKVDSAILSNPIDNNIDNTLNSSTAACSTPGRPHPVQGSVVASSGAGLTCVGSTVSRPRGIDILLAAPPAAPRRPPAPHHPPIRHYGPRARSSAPTDAHHKQEKHFPDNAIFHEFTGLQHLSSEVF